MTSFEELLKAYVELSPEARYPFLSAKMDSVIGYCEYWPQLTGALRTITLKIVAADGIIDENEVGILNAIKMVYSGSFLDIEKFVKDIVALVDSGLDASAAEGAFSMLPEFAKDDIVTLGIALAAIDGKIAAEEAAYLKSLCE